MQRGEKERRQSGTQRGIRNSEGECTAGRTETWLKTRGPHDSTAIHKHTCLQPVLPPTPRLSWWVHWPFLTTQNCAGLRRTILPHPCLWQVHRGGVEEGVPESPRTLTPLDQHKGRNRTLLSESASVASAELVIFKLGP